MKRLVLLMLLCLSCWVKSNAQDIQFSQFYANQVWLSPAFTGSSIGPRVALNARSQWVGVPDAYRTFACSFDTPVDFGQSRHGLGLTFAADQQGEGSLTKLDVLANYSFRLLINDRHAIRFGLGVGFQQTSIDFYRLRFPNQYNAVFGLDPNLPNNEAMGDARINEEITFGTLYYNKFFWLGINLNHLTTPRQRLLTSQPVNEESLKLPLKLSAFTGFNIPLNNKETKSISPSILFRHQGPFNQLDLGMYVNLNPIVFGAYFRTIQPDALIGLVGIQKGMFRFGYSYDFTVSSLTNGISGGSHEISFVVEFDKLPKKAKKHSVNMSCPKF